MNTLTRRIAIAGVAGATMIGGLTFAATTSGAQDSGDTTTTQVAPAPDGTNNQQAPDANANGDQGPRPDGDCQQGGRHHRGPNLEVAADAIGISAEDLHTALEDGSTIAEVAQAHDVDPQTVIDALVNDVKSHLDEQVSNGDLTQDEADQKLADATERITDHVNNGKPERPQDGPHGDQAPNADQAPAPGN